MPIAMDVITSTANGENDMNCPNGRFLRNKFVYEKWIKPLDIDNILDVGCSNNYMKILHKNTTGIDIQGNPDIKFNLEKGPIPLKENSFDCVVCLDVLEHLDNLHEVLDQLIKISKRFVILSFPNEIRWLHLLRYTYKTNDRDFGLNPRNRHKWFLSYTQSRDFFHNYAKQKNLIIYDEFISLGNISKILHRLLNFKFPNLMPYTYFVVAKKSKKKG